MKKLFYFGLSSLLATATIVHAQGWVDVDRTGVMDRGGVYCTSIRNLTRFGEYAQDRDAAGADRMVFDGRCVIAQNALRATIIQEDEHLASFISPSGKLFWTFKELIK